MSRSNFTDYAGLTVRTEALQQNNYVSVAIAVAVMYDYVLTFPSEIEYVWAQHWTFVSSLFVIIRYLGCCCALQRNYSLICKDVSAPLNTTWLLHSTSPGYALYTLAQFAFLLFLAAADLVMILRVWAMYNTSKLILGILLVVYIPEIVLTTVVAVIASTPGHTEVITVLNRSFCLPVLPLYHWLEDALVFLFPAGLTCILAIIRFVREWLQMRRVTEQSTLNRYMKLLSRESIIYFLVILCFGLVNVHNHSIAIAGQTWFGFLVAISCVPVFTLAPRSILSLRALYARGPKTERCCGIDTGFGFSDSWSHMGLEGTAMVFADAGETQKAEEKYMKEMEDAWGADDIC